MIEELREWQYLAGSIVVALAGLAAMGRVLGAERRRRMEEAGFLRAAIGSEFRQIARHALAVQEEVLKLLPSANPTIISPTRTVKDLQGVVRFPEAAIYSHAGSGVGAAGRYAQDIVAFYHELWRIRDGLSQVQATGNLELQMLSVPTSQLLDVAASLLAAVGAATPAVNGLGPCRSVNEEFERELEGARERLVALRKSLTFRA